MVHFRNKHNPFKKQLCKSSAGFTLIEAILSTVIMALVLTTVIVSQSALFRSVVTRSRSYERLVQAKYYMHQMRRKVPQDARQFHEEKKATKPTTTLIYDLKEPQGTSALASTGTILIEQVRWEWQEGRTKRTDSMITLLYKPQRGAS